MSSHSTNSLSKEFIDLVKGIGESKSKTEEDAIVLHEVATLKGKMFERGVTTKRMREYLLRMLYVEMLGHDASFGHINAVKMAHGTTLGEKRVGYLAVSICLHPEHELMLLLVNTFQHDLASKNYLDVAMALLVTTRLINKELLRALLPLIAKAIDHHQANVRKKAIATLHRCYQIDPESIESHMDKILSILCDKDPSVMGAALPFYLELARVNPAPFKELVPSFVSILKQITEHRLSRDYDYRRMPAPWIQIKLIQLLGVIGASDKSCSEGMYEILHEAIRRSDTGINIGYALIYECVRTITSIFPNPALLEEAAKCVSRFISSEYHNRKYLGIDALASIVQIDSQYAAQHQLVVIDCLDDPDETLCRKTLDLLYRMTNSVNVTVIVENMMRFLGAASSDTFLRKDLVEKITSVAERFAPSNEWYIQTLNNIFALGGDIVPYSVSHNVMRLIASSQDDLQIYAVDSYIQVLIEDLDRKQASQMPLASHNSTTDIPERFIQVIAWTLGQFGYRSSQYSVISIIRLLDTFLRRTSYTLEATRSWILSSLLKLVPHVQPIPASMYEMADAFRHSISVDLQQRSHELFDFCRMPGDVVKEVLPEGDAFQPLEIDPRLPFLDVFVNQAKSAGAKTYCPPDDNANQISEPSNQSGGLNFNPYILPSNIKDGAFFAPNVTSEQSSVRISTTAASAIPVQTTSTSSLNLSGVTRRWGPAGYTGLAPEVISPEINISEPNSNHQAEPMVQAAVARPSGSVFPVAKSEKEVRAAQLFSGVSYSSTPPTSGVATTSIPSSPGQVGFSSRPSATPDVAVHDDLLGLQSDFTPSNNMGPAQFFSQTGSEGPLAPGMNSGVDPVDILGAILGGNDWTAQSCPEDHTVSRSDP